jgi:TolA-binding protein
MKTRYKILSLSAVAVAWFASTASVVTDPLVSPNSEGYLQRSRMMMSAGNYAGVIDQLKLMAAEKVALSDSEKEEAAYMLAKAAYERGDEQCVALLKQFVSEHPTSPLAITAGLEIGDYYFFKHEYGPALVQYSDIDIDGLNGDRRNLYTYRKALSMVKTGDYSSARKLLTSLSGSSEYKSASRFYMAYIDYAEGNDEKAYSEFSKLSGSFDSRYYMTQIDFKRENYSKVIKEGKQLISESERPEMIPEINRLVGESYFKLGDENSAKGYLDSYLKSAGESAAVSAVYTSAVIDYDNDNYDEAASKFSKLTDLRSDIGQSAYLYLGQCAAESGDEQLAAMSFKKAYEMDFDKSVTETALYNYVAAVTRGGNIPFASSGSMLEDFLARFPRSDYAPKVEEYLATAYYNENNYSRALESINRIPNQTASVLTAKQKVVYELGIESMSNGKSADAVKYLEEAVKLSSYDRQLATQANLWLGDARYAEGDYSGAASAYESYLNSDRKGTNRSLAMYDLAYALYMQGKYTQADKRFDEALKTSPSLPSSLKHDATVRQADCKYYTGDYKTALSSYTSAISSGSADADYATYRRAIMYGLSGDTKRKLSELSSMTQTYPESKWLPAALQEKAATYMSLDDTKNGIAAYESLVNNYPRSSEARQGMLQLAIAYSQTGQNKKAEETYKSVISHWPSSEEASLANEDLRRIYASRGELQQYASFLKSIPNAPQLNEDEMEKLTFDAAETAFAADINDVSKLESYISTYPNGRYLAQSLLDLSESYTESGKYDKALDLLNKLISRRGDSQQAPEALLRKGELLEYNISGGRKEALSAYKELANVGGTDYAADAYCGIMRTTDNASERLKYARLAKQSGGLSSEQIEEASYYEALALEQSGSKADAVEIYKSLSRNVKSLSGAKAAVALGEYYLETGKYDLAEKTLTEFTEEGTPHQYWLARGFIALADTYHAKGKNYTALEYIRSLKDNYPGDELDINDMINQRLKSWK